MASTIQIKNSTTSGNSPSSLATGELAINVVDGNFFYGSASAVKQDFALGNLTATNTSISGTLSIEGSGSTLFEVVGSEGQLFSITDNLSGSLFAVSDVSGLPILEVFSDDTVKIGTFNNEGIIVGGSNVTASGNVDIQGILSIPGFTNVSASLAAAVAGGDDLGNHTATQNLDMGGNAITNVGNVDGVDVSALNSTVSTNTSNIATLTAATSSYSTATGVENNADVTDTANVTAAGALMDSEVDADIKTLSLPANTTISTFGASLIDDTTAAAARTTLGVDASGTDNSTDVTLVTTSHNYLSIAGQAITLGTIDISDDTNLVAGGGISLTGDTLSVAAGTGLTQGATGLSFDADGGTLTTNNADVDHILINDGGTFKRITKGNINVGDFNNDAGYTTNTGTVTSVGGTGTVSGLSLSGTVTTSGNLTLGGTISISSTNITDVDAFSQTGTYASLRAQGTTAGDVGLGNVENTALSTWAGSSNLTTLGTVTSGNINAILPSGTVSGSSQIDLGSATGTAANASTASYVAGSNVDGTVASATVASIALDSTNASNIDVNNVSGNSEYGLVFRDGNSDGNQPLYADSELDQPSYNPSTNTIKTPIISASSALHVGGDITATGTLSLPGFSDVSASLAAAVAGGDDLGNHTATQDLNMGGNAITSVGNVDGRDVSADGSKLDGIEAGADVTDTANVTAAGALMDSEVDADIKTLSLPANTTISTFGASLIDDTTSTAARTTIGLGNVENTALSTYTGNGGALDNQYITNGAGYTTNTGTVDTSGTPSSEQIALFSDSDTIQGSSKLTFDVSDTQLRIAASNSDGAYIVIDGGAYSTQAYPYIDAGGLYTSLTFGSSTSGRIFDFKNNKIAFDVDSTNTYIMADTSTPENLEIHADGNIELRADDGLEIYSNITGSASNILLTQPDGGGGGFNYLRSSGDIAGGTFQLEVGDIDDQYNGTKVVVDDANTMVTITGSVNVNTDVIAAGIVLPQYETKVHTFFTTDANGDLIPMGGTLSETTTPQYYLNYMPPYGGQLIKAYVMTTSGGTGNFEISLRRYTNFSTFTTIASGSATISTSYTPTLVEFSPHSFDAGDWLAMNFDPTGTPSGVNVTSLWRMDSI